MEYFGEINGNVSIKIRFNAKGEGQDSSGVQNTSYKRKSEKQLNRDRNRARKRKRVISSEAENSLECVRQGETSSNQNYILDSVLDDQFSCVTPIDLPPVNEIEHGNIDFENLQNVIEATLSDNESSLNSTTSAATTNIEIPDTENLFLIKDYPETVSPVPDPDASVSDRDWKTQMRKDLQQNDRAWLRHRAKCTPLGFKLYPFNQ